MRHAYAGIGSRQTPEKIQKKMVNAAAYLESKNWVLRSGGAKGADSAFSLGVDSWDNKEIYLPWKGFNGHHTTGIDIIGFDHEILREAYGIAKRFHPAWDRLDSTGQRLMTRNTFQICGSDLLSPVKMVICWTPFGTGAGGTGQALRIAHHLKIPIFDLGKPNQVEVENDCLELVKQLQGGTL